MTMADKIVVLNAGRIEQYGTPMELYKTPANRFVAGFIGSPRMNFLEGAPAEKYGAHAIGVRPEHLGVSETAGEWTGKVGVVEHLGSDTFLHVHVEGAGLVTVRTEGERAIGHGVGVFLSPDPAHVYRFDRSGLAIH
jgi:multiple sugar transport system ATP-binding protein